MTKKTEKLLCVTCGKLTEHEMDGNIATCPECGTEDVAWKD